MKQLKTIIIIGGSISGMTAALALQGVAQQLIILEKQSRAALQAQHPHYVTAIDQQANIFIRDETSVQGLALRCYGDISGVYVQNNNNLTFLQADMVINASGTDSKMALWLQCVGYEAVKTEQETLVLSHPRTRTMTLTSHRYDTMSELPQGLYMIGNTLSNIAKIANRQADIASIEAQMLKNCLVKGSGCNMQFHKQLGRIIGLIIKEYRAIAHQSITRERHFETIQQPTADNPALQSSS